MKTPQIAALPGMSPLGFASPQAALRHHVSGAIERGEGVAIVESPASGPNAALIAAAPELLAALKSALSWITVLTETSPGNAEDMRDIEHKRDYLGAELRAAIAKAGGR